MENYNLFKLRAIPTSKHSETLSLALHILVAAWQIKNKCSYIVKIVRTTRSSKNEFDFNQYYKDIEVY